MAESFVKTMKRDYAAFMPTPDAATAARNLAIAFEHYNEKHPHSALKHRSPREFRRSMDSAILSVMPRPVLQGQLQRGGMSIRHAGWGMGDCGGMA